MLKNSAIGKKWILAAWHLKKQDRTLSADTRIELFLNRIVKL
jgi:hypothetical protein